MPRRIVLLTLIPLALLASCTASGGRGTSATQLEELASRLAGTFTSEAQASTDPSNYFNVRLVMAPIWPERRDGKWLYVEQALATALDKPYRQRIYQLTSGVDGKLTSSVYTLPGDPLDLAGAWQNPSKFDDLAPQFLAERDGCEIVLTFDQPKDQFVGSTVGKNCPSDLRGASYATSEVAVSRDGIISWDRGFDAAGNQVWGATMGGYQFVKIAR